MNKNMTLGELIQQKTIAEEKIESIINGFSSLTGVPIESIEVDLETIAEPKVLMQLVIPKNFRHDWNFEPDYIEKQKKK